LIGVPDGVPGAERPSPHPSPLLGVYRIPEQRFVRGEGSFLVDSEGRRYLDFTSGIAVNALGHGSTVVAEAVARALETGLIHTSNLFRTEPAEQLARLLVHLTGMDRAFFCNSGAEAVEGSLKFARRWARSEGGAEKHRVVAFRGGFHGRLFGSLSITDRPDYRAPFEPLMPGVDFVEPRVGPELLAVLDRERTAAVVVEPIQGEGGVRPLPPEFLQALRVLTQERNILLVLDEIQCGVGRTGSFTAHAAMGIRPDLLILAKPLAGGLPMGAVLLTDAVADSIQPGDHGTTFGGGPLVASVALAVVETLSEPAFLSEVRRKGRRLEAGLRAMADRHPHEIQEVRGRGLMWGIQLREPVAPWIARARDRGLLLVGAGPDVLRLLPPLSVTDDELDEALVRLGQAFQGGER